MESDLTQAINTLKSKKWVDLTHTFGPNSPHFAAFDDAEFKTLLIMMTDSSLRTFLSRGSMEHISMHQSTSYATNVMSMNWD